MKVKPSFLDHYQTFFQSTHAFDSWLQSLTFNHSPVLVFSPATKRPLERLWHSHGLDWQPLPWYPFALNWPLSLPLGTKLPGYDQHLFYALNPASILPVLALDLNPDHLVLDACAAPGGKSILIANMLAESSFLTTNDISPARAHRLKLSLNQAGHAAPVLIQPAQALASNFPQTFDRILLDAPCSSEKHVFSSPKHLKSWSPSRPKILSKRQFQLIKSLIPALKSGGRLVYATCAFTPQENEQVVQIVLKKIPSLSLTSWSPPIKLQNESGLNFPHLNHTLRVSSQNPQGLDPMFVAVFTKVS